jgi:hypothetical protein
LGGHGEDIEMTAQKGNMLKEETDFGEGEEKGWKRKEEKNRG